MLDLLKVYQKKMNKIQKRKEDENRHTTMVTIRYEKIKTDLQSSQKDSPQQGMRTASDIRSVQRAHTKSEGMMDLTSSGGGDSA